METTVLEICLEEGVLLMVDSTSSEVVGWILLLLQTTDRFQTCLPEEPTLKERGPIEESVVDWRIPRTKNLAWHRYPCQASGILVLAPAFALQIGMVAESSWGLALFQARLSIGEVEEAVSRFGIGKA